MSSENYCESCQIYARKRLNQRLPKVELNVIGIRGSCMGKRLSAIFSGLPAYCSRSNPQNPINAACRRAPSESRLPPGDELLSDATSRPAAAFSTRPALEM